MIDWLFRKPPRTKKTCPKCGSSGGLAHPHFPYCSAICKEVAEKPPDEPMELLYKPPEDELVKLLQYP